MLEIKQEFTKTMKIVKNKFINILVLCIKNLIQRNKLRNILLNKSKKKMKTLNKFRQMDVVKIMEEQMHMLKLKFFLKIMILEIYQKDYLVQNKQIIEQKYLQLSEQLKFLKIIKTNLIVTIKLLILKIHLYRILKNQLRLV